ncbi:MAG: DUF6101 family protein [Pseudomonadota bacterium]
MAVRGRHPNGKQAVETAEKPSWASADWRADPYALPQKIDCARENGSLSGRSSRRAFEFTLDHAGAVLKCDLECGLPLSMSLPKRAFLGVAARAFENEDGSNTVTLELMHTDPDLCVPLCVSDQMEDAAADWHSWANRMGLPMLMVDQTGEISTVRDAGVLIGDQPQPRRRKTSSVKHRPNFLRRRKMGVVGPVVRIDAEEIIART